MPLEDLFSGGGCLNEMLKPSKVVNLFLILRIYVPFPFRDANEAFCDKRLIGPPRERFDDAALSLEIHFRTFFCENPRPP